VFRVNDNRGHVGHCDRFRNGESHSARADELRTRFATQRGVPVLDQCRMICSESAAAQHEPPLARRSGGRGIPGGRPEGGAADRSAGGRGAITLQRARFFRPR
jgi:hypothetical protein